MSVVQIFDSKSAKSLKITDLALCVIYDKPLDCDSIHGSRQHCACRRMYDDRCNDCVCTRCGASQTGAVGVQLMMNAIKNASMLDSDCSLHISTNVLISIPFNIKITFNYFWMDAYTDDLDVMNLVQLNNTDVQMHTINHLSIHCLFLWNPTIVMRELDVFIEILNQVLVN